MTTLSRQQETPSAVVKCLQDHHFVHFVCHGYLEPEKPLNASFGLHGGNRITLLKVVWSRLLPAAEIVFLSACHTAALTGGSIADEGVEIEVWKNAQWEPVGKMMALNCEIGGLRSTEWDEEMGHDCPIFFLPRPRPGEGGCIQVRYWRVEQRGRERREPKTKANAVEWRR